MTRKERFSVVSMPIAKADSKAPDTLCTIKHTKHFLFVDLVDTRQTEVKKLQEAKIAWSQEKQRLAKDAEAAKAKDQSKAPSSDKSELKAALEELAGAKAEVNRSEHWSNMAICFIYTY